MKKYLVGGAIRDELLQLPVKEKDWVVVGSSSEEMLNIGYEKVGKNFPVFLHPKNNEEYALARTEKKSGTGYTGFICNSSSNVTLEEDLQRRDLTINAMARDTQGNLIDPYNGQKDLKSRILRHIAPTFCEDPLRILRVARFSAKLAHLHFNIAPETLILMKKMVNELYYLSPERIWLETKKALITKNPQVYFQVLYNCGALKIIFPELYVLFGTPTLMQCHTEIDTGQDTMLSLSKISRITDNLCIRFAVLCHSLGKGQTPKHNLPKHLNHEKIGIQIIKNFCHRLRIPNRFYKFSKITTKYYKYFHNIKILSPELLIEIFNVFDCWRHPENINQITLIGLTNLENYINDTNEITCNNKKFLLSAYSIANKIKTSDIIKNGFTGIKIKEELNYRRICILKKWKKN